MMVAAWRSEKYPAWNIKDQRMVGSGGDGEEGREGGREGEREREGRRERGATEGKIQGWTFGPTDLGSNASHTTS